MRYTIIKANSNSLIGYSSNHIVSIKKVLRRLFKVAIKEDIIKFNPTDDFKPYLLRHTFCTDYQNAGPPINIAKEFMSHYDVNTTAKIYTHTTDEMYELCRRKLNDYYSNKFS